MNEQLDKLTFDEKRCTWRKHVIENNKGMCDCGRIIIGPTVAGNARVVTLLHGFKDDA